MRDFQFHTPSTLAEAHSLLSDYGEEARVISGGTGLINMMKQDLIYVDHLVSLQNVDGLNYIRATGEGLQIGGRTTQQEMATSSVVHENNPLLTETYGEVATVRVRNAATVGGGVAHGDPAQDPPPTLLVLDASIHVASKDGERTVKARDGWFVDYYTTGVEEGEIVTGITVPAAPANAKTTYIKFLPRTADDYPTVAVSALGVVDGGIVTDVRVGLGAVNSTAVYADTVAGVLVGKEPTADLVREAAETVRDLCAPTPDFRGSAEYKTDMAVVFTRRALTRVLGLE